MIWVTLLIAGCAGPKYKLVYDYAAPTTPQGAICVQRCDDSRKNCEQWAQQEYQKCLLNQQRQTQLTETPSFGGLGSVRYERPLREPNECMRLRDPKQFCQHEYNACYELCGGKITAREECAENCK